MKLWFPLLSLVVFTYSDFANSAWFTSDGSNFQECMENRRSDIKNESQMAIAAQYCRSKHPPPKSVTPETPYDPVVDNSFLGTEPPRPTLRALINNIDTNRLTTKHYGTDYGSGVKSNDFRYYLSVEVINRNEFPVVGIFVGVSKSGQKSGKCSWNEKDYVDIYACKGFAAGKTSSSFACDIPNVEKREVNTCVLGFVVRGNNADIKHFMQSHNIPPRQ